MTRMCLPCKRPLHFSFLISAALFLSGRAAPRAQHPLAGGSFDGAYWPNKAVREGIKGMESSKLAARARHQVILPFTRYLAGGADYTTMIFNQRRADTTWANQIASNAILNSPLQTIAANPQSILTNPAVEIIRSIPSTWDETIVLPVSEIGELAVWARRSGSVWFLAVMNGVRAGTVRIPLSFLPTGNYQAIIVRDDQNNPAAVKIENKTMKRGDKISIELNHGGGFIARFSPQ